MAGEPRIFSERARFIPKHERPDAPQVEAAAEALCYWIYPEITYGGGPRRDCIGFVKAMLHVLKAHGWELRKVDKDGRVVPAEDVQHEPGGLGLERKRPAAKPRGRPRKVKL